MAHDVEPRLLVLRSMAAIRAYLEDYPIAPDDTADSGWLTLPQWLADGDDCDEDRFALATRLGYPAVRLRAVPMQNSKGLVAVAMEDCENP